MKTAWLAISCVLLNRTWILNKEINELRRTKMPVLYRNGARDGSRLRTCFQVKGIH